MQELVLTTIETLKAVISETVKCALENTLPAEPIKEISPIEFLTRKEAAKLLHVSLPTLDLWSKTGIIKAYRIGARVLFKSDEIDQSLNLMKVGR